MAFGGRPIWEGRRVESLPVSPSEPDHGSEPVGSRQAISLPDGYRPSADEPFMNALQQTYFRKKLLDWREDIQREAQETLSELKAGSLHEADMADRASSESDWSVHLRTRDRQRKLIGKINAALRRLEAGEYGYCEVTGDPISLGRLDARPIATMTVEAQEAHEKNEKVSRDN